VGSQLQIEIIMVLNIHINNYF